MKKDSATFRDVVERVCAGSEEAVHELIETYGPHMQRVVRRKLSQQMRSKFDSLDFVQMVWASFFAERERIGDFKEPEDLIRYLVKMAQHKLMQESRRRFRYQKQNLKRESSLEEQSSDESSHAGKSHTPSQIVMAKERLDRLMRKQSERDRRILALRMGGATFSEISAELGIHERTARLVIEKLTPSQAE